MKRPREEEDEGNGAQQEAAAAEAGQEEPGSNGGAAVQAQDEEDDKPLLANYKMSRSVKKGHECPYLDTISRQVGRAGGGGVGVGWVQGSPQPTASWDTSLAAFLTSGAGARCRCCHFCLGSLLHLARKASLVPVSRTSSWCPHLVCT